MYAFYMPLYGQIRAEEKTIEFKILYCLRWLLQYQTLAPQVRSGAVDRASDFGPRDPWFDSPPVHISLWP